MFANWFTNTREHSRNDGGHDQSLASINRGVKTGVQPNPSDVPHNDHRRTGHSNEAPVTKKDTQGSGEEKHDKSRIHHIKKTSGSSSKKNVFSTTQQQDRKRPFQTDHSSSNHQRTNKRPKKRTPLTREALELSQKLQELSRKKQLQESLELYASAQYASVRDAHHACMLVDCCARCGDITTAERIVNEIGCDKVTVEMQTALMKGYAHAGWIHAGMQRFRSMVIHPDPLQRPNVRTLNTLLRGCMWSASNVSTLSISDISGGVVSSEEAWSLFGTHVGSDHFDTSSFEYSISLLAQALRLEDVQRRIDEFQTKYDVRIKGKATISLGNCAAPVDPQTVLESLAVAYLSLARAQALRGKDDAVWTSCQRVLCATKSSRAYLNAESVDNKETNQKSPKPNRKQRQPQGGKRAWKTTPDEHDVDVNRSLSNLAYRNHRLAELEDEAKDLLKLRGKCSANLSDVVVASRLLRYLFYFHGGGTTELYKARSKKRKTGKSELLTIDGANLTPLMESFGLSQLLPQESTGINARTASSPVTRAHIQASLGLATLEPLAANGVMNFHDIFPNHKNAIDIELGSGFGSWIVQQARDFPSRNYVAVELRADRVFQIFARSILNGAVLDNLCVVGADCNIFLRNRIAKASITTFFANHPEPPTQTFGGDANDLDKILAGGDEPAHMLCSQTIDEMARCLKPKDGKIVIVTDNRWYGSLLAATFCRVIRNGHLLVSQTPDQVRGSGLSPVGAYGDGNDKVFVFQGIPGSEHGHSSQRNVGEHGISYFDRLWRTGAGSHAERRLRFVVILRRTTQKVS